MALCDRVLKNGVGGKAVIAITGLMLSGFAIAHMSGHLLMFAGEDAYNGYAAKLKALGGLLWVARLGLLGAFLLHISMAIKLNIENKLARPERYRFEQTMKASFASRYMVHTGLLIFVFVLYHLAHFTFRIADPATNAVEASNVYGMMIAGLSNPVISSFYILAVAALGLHLRHGFASAFQSLGARHPNLTPHVEKLSVALAFIVFAGYASVPLSILMGCIK